jgi:hypothetical protein
MASCRWAVQMSHYCAGPPPPPDYRESPGCVCHECLADADCGDGGKCVWMSGQQGCSGNLQVCVRPGDACFPPASCQQQCLWASTGGPPHAICGVPGPIPP